MDIVKELKKQAKEIMKDEKIKEKAADAVEGLLKEVKKNVKGKDKKEMLDKAIKAVDDATTSKKKKTEKKTKKK